ncbi:hypothetical protein ACFXN2_02005 [Streptomyces kronopolitis]|uniref:hypothetical protein n=1 Tax=Streptomyces kronopolitis TaxID=1612435 RepID=UPI00369DEE80
MIGVVERFNSNAEIQEVFPLIAGATHPVFMPRGERHLLRGWSPYVDMQPTIITGGRTPFVSLVPPARPSRPSSRAPGSSGWICLWQNADGQWSPRSMATDSPATWPNEPEHRGPSTPPVTPNVVWSMQAGGANRAPTCTLMPSRTEMTVIPLSRVMKGPLEVRPIADSGYTLLEALRTGRMHAALAIQDVWQQASAKTGGRPSLFDLAVGYTHCRRGDVQRVQQWLQYLPYDLSTGEGASDIRAVATWLAQRTQSRFDSRDLIDRLAESRTLPMAAEGLHILAGDVRRLTQDRRTEWPTSWRWLEHCLNSSAHTALTTYTADAPDHPTRAPRRRVPPPHEESLHFKLAPASDGARIQWQPTHALEQQMVATQAWRGSDVLHTHRSTGTFTLIIRHREPEWLWHFARQLMTRTEVRPIVFRDIQTLELRLTERDLTDISRELNAVGDHVRNEWMTLSASGAEEAMEDSAVSRLADLLPGLHLTGDDE